MWPWLQTLTPRIHKDAAIHSQNIIIMSPKNKEKEKTENYQSIKYEQARNKIGGGGN
jgi:hypothetical protein